MEALLATLLDPGADAFRVSHLEMIKGLAGHGYADELVIPIVENTARECQLTASLRAAMAAHPSAPAVLVRRHGVYVWGATWQAAKTQVRQTCPARIGVRALPARACADLRAVSVSAG